jgi:glycosyltransferase involved in cell wall biosynthesis
MSIDAVGPNGAGEANRSRPAGKAGAGGQVAVSAVPSHPMRILHIFGCMVRGGAETRTVELFRVLDRRKYIFEFCSLSGQPGELDDEILALGGKVHLLKLNAGFPWAFLRLLRDRRFAVVHSHVHLFTGVILLLAAIAGVPKRIAHFRSTADEKGNGLWRRARNSVLRHLLNHVATDIVGVSRATLEMVLGSAWRADPRCQVIYSGIAVERFQVTADPAGVRNEFGFPKGAILVIHVGRMCREKNPERLAHIFLHFAQLVPDARLIMVGKRDAEIESRIAVIAQTYPATGRIAFAGVREDVGRLLASSDLMLFPSLQEGLPGAVVEAAAAGIPVLASDIPGISELAARLPGIQTISLARPDDYWASCALAAHERRFNASGRDRAFPALFDVGCARIRFEQLYNPVREEHRSSANA